MKRVMERISSSIRISDDLCDGCRTDSGAHHRKAQRQQYCTVIAARIPRVEADALR
jgi:hypothetical protein